MEKRPAYWSLRFHYDGNYSGGYGKGVADLTAIGQEINIQPLHYYVYNMDSLTPTELENRIDGIASAVQGGDVLFYLHPLSFTGKRFPKRFLEKMRARGVHIVMVLADVEFVRYPWGAKKIEEVGRSYYELELLHFGDVLIVASELMAQKLRSFGLDKKYIIMRSLPYLSEYYRANKDENFRQITFAGNIDKSKFLEQIDLDVPIHYYGLLNDEKLQASVIAHGNFRADELVGQLKYGFGLVWDETTDDSDENVKEYGDFYKEYTRYNSAIKISLYLASHLPIILWKENAQAHWIEELGLGFAIDNLSELSDKLHALTAEDYEKYCQRVRNYSKVITDGMDFKIAAFEAMRYVLSMPVK